MVEVSVASQGVSPGACLGTVAVRACQPFSPVISKVVRLFGSVGVSRNGVGRWLGWGWLVGGGGPVWVVGGGRVGRGFGSLRGVRRSLVLCVE